MTSAAEEQLARRFELRIARAEALAQKPSSGREPLQFAAGLFRAQAQAAAAVLEVHRRKATLVGSPEADPVGAAARATEILDGLAPYA